MALGEPEGGDLASEWKKSAYKLQDQRDAALKEVKELKEKLGTGRGS